VISLLHFNMVRFWEFSTIPHKGRVYMVRHLWSWGDGVLAKYPWYVSLVPPKISKGPGQIQGTEGEEIAILCKADGLPDPKFEFLKVSIKITSLISYFFTKRSLRTWTSVVTHSAVVYLFTVDFKSFFTIANCLLLCIA